MNRYKFHTDPGHGWLEVKRAELVRLGISAEITPFSYQSRDGSTVYLEEDCDASTFARALERRGGLLYFDEQHHEGEHWIRSLPYYQGGQSRAVVNGAHRRAE